MESNTASEQANLNIPAVNVLEWAAETQIGTNKGIHSTVIVLPTACHRLQWICLTEATYNTTDSPRACTHTYTVIMVEPMCALYPCNEFYSPHLLNEMMCNSKPFPEFRIWFFGMLDQQPDHFPTGSFFIDQFNLVECIMVSPIHLPLPSRHTGRRDDNGDPQRPCLTHVIPCIRSYDWALEDD